MHYSAETGRDVASLPFRNIARDRMYAKRNEVLDDEPAADLECQPPPIAGQYVDFVRLTGS